MVCGEFWSLVFGVKFSRGMPEQNSEHVLDEDGNPSRSFLQILEFHIATSG
jgi:hypothetical protein